MLKLKLLYLFIRTINFFYSNVGYRILHSFFAAIFGYCFGYWNFYYLSLRMVYFLFCYFLFLEFVSILFFNPKISYRLGLQILEEIKEQIERKRQKN